MNKVYAVPESASYAALSEVRGLPCVAAFPYPGGMVVELTSPLFLADDDPRRETMPDARGKDDPNAWQAINAIVARHGGTER